MNPFKDLYVLRGPGGSAPAEIQRDVQRLDQLLPSVHDDAFAYAALGLICIETPELEHRESALDHLERSGYSVIDHWQVPAAEGDPLIVNLRYADGQVVSASLHENQMLTALGGLEGHALNDRRDLAIAALITDNDFPDEAVLGRTIEIQEVLRSVEPWDETMARKWSPSCWDPTEPMVEVSFQPQAVIAGDRIIDVEVDDMPESWWMPARLVPDGCDPSRIDSLDDLATLPCAPEKVRAWTGLCPFSVEIENPEVLADFRATHAASPAP